MNDKFQINVTLHGEIDAVSVFGDILFSNGINTIIENDTFVDSWLAAFIENIDKIIKLDQIEIDVIDEPDLVIIKSINRELKFIYKNNELTINSIDEFIFQLKEASKEIMSFYDINQDFGKNVQLKIIEEFSNN